MNISDIKKNKVGQGIGGFDLTVARCKRSKKLASGKWMQRVVLLDKTGEIYADMNIDTFTPITNGEVIHALVCEVQAVDPESKALGDKKLWIEEFTKVSQGSEPELKPDYGASNVIGIKCHIVNGMFAGGWVVKHILEAMRGQDCKELIDEILK